MYVYGVIDISLSMENLEYSVSNAVFKYLSVNVVIQSLLESKS